MELPKDLRKMNKEQRVKLKLEFQRELFRKLYEKTKAFDKAARFLDLSCRGSYANYHYCKTRFVPISVVDKVAKFLKLDPKAILQNIEEIITLPDIRRKYCIPKTFEKFRSIYGYNWGKEVIKPARLKLKEMYGENIGKELSKRSSIVLEKKYGKNWQKILSKRGVKALRKKFGKEWYKNIQIKARNTLKEKYGEDWAKKLSKLGSISLKKKFGEDYPRKLRKLAKIKSPLTSIETKFYKILKRYKISFDYHEVIDDVEFDFLIPTKENPKIICEVSTIKPNIHNLRFKISQLLIQKERFPNTDFVCVLNKKFTDHNGCHIFHPDIGKYLLDKGFIIFWLDELRDAIELIKSVNENNSSLFNLYYNKRSKEFESELKNIAPHIFKGAKNVEGKMSEVEKHFHNLLIKIGAKPLGSIVVKTKYGGFATVDNCEEINGNKIIYEILEKNNPFRMAVLAGKLSYLRDDNIKIVTVLPNLSKPIESYGFKRLLKFSDAVILKDDLGEAIFQKIRNRLLTN